jgi:hypothetical protein
MTLFEINKFAPVVANCESQVDVPVEIVWQVLSDISAWPEWNHSVRKLSCMARSQSEPGLTGWLADRK